MEWFEQRRAAHLISTDPALIDIDRVWGWLRESYWARGIPRATCERSLQNSLNFGLYAGPTQLGFARVISDYATFAYLCDVMIAPEARGQGLGHWLMETLLAHPDLQGLRRFLLVTLDAQGLYAKHGFSVIEHPERHMAILKPNIYLDNAAAETTPG